MRKGPVIFKLKTLSQRTKITIQNNYNKTSVTHWQNVARKLKSIAAYMRSHIRKNLYNYFCALYKKLGANNGCKRHWCCLNRLHARKITQSTTTEIIYYILKTHFAGAVVQVGEGSGATCSIGLTAWDNCKTKKVCIIKNMSIVIEISISKINACAIYLLLFYRLRLNHRLPSGWVGR